MNLGNVNLGKQKNSNIDSSKEKNTKDREGTNLKKKNLSGNTNWLRNKDCLNRRAKRRWRKKKQLRKKI